MWALTYAGILEALSLMGADIQLENSGLLLVSQWLIYERDPALNCCTIAGDLIPG